MSTKSVAKENKVYIKHIITASELAITFLLSFRRREFIESEGIEKPAVVRELEIIGEASARISKDYIEKHANIPWRKMIDMRNKIIHEYNDVDYAIVWETVKYDLPKLVKKLYRLLEEK